MEEEKSVAYTLKQYLEYEAELQKMISISSMERIYNDSFVHAVLVLETLIQKAKKDQIRILYMYCGEFSLFRDSKAKELQQELDRVKPEENDNLFAKWKQFKPYEKLLSTLTSYLNGGGKLSLVVDRDISDIKKEECWKSLEKNFSNGLIETYKLAAPIGLNHFFVAGSSYRRENNHDSKQAVCCFNNQETSKMLITSHQLLRSVSTISNLR